VITLLNAASCPKDFATETFVTGVITSDELLPPAGVPLFTGVLTGDEVVAVTLVTVSRGCKDYSLQLVVPWYVAPAAFRATADKFRGGRMLLSAYTMYAQPTDGSVRREYRAALPASADRPATRDCLGQYLAELLYSDGWVERGYVAVEAEGFRVTILGPQAEICYWSDAAYDKTAELIRTGVAAYLGVRDAQVWLQKGARSDTHDIIHR
jgi:hypothetical protein